MALSKIYFFQEFESKMIFFFFIFTSEDFLLSFFFLWNSLLNTILNIKMVMLVFSYLEFIIQIFGREKKIIIFDWLTLMFLSGSKVRDIIKAGLGFSLQYNFQEWDLSYRMDLDHWDCFGRGKHSHIIKEIHYWLEFWQEGFIPSCYWNLCQSCWLNFLKKDISLQPFSRKHSYLDHSILEPRVHALGQGQNLGDC